MQILHTVDELQRVARELYISFEDDNHEAPQVGLTPTMGALHLGHISLVEQMMEECGIGIVSLFVNPAQFGEGEDFDKYPRALEADAALCEQAGADIVFAPSADEMYPAGYETMLKAGSMAERFCGLSRPGHFDGVITVCCKLFNICQPDFAYFGEKDFQQLCIVERMLRDLHLDIQLVACPIVREEDGLALSSRNKYLGDAERAEAPKLHKALQAMDAAFRGGEHEVKVLRGIGAHELEPWTGNGFSLEYLEVADPYTLEVKAEAAPGDRALIAAHLGETRLIDNIELGSEE